MRSFAQAQAAEVLLTERTRHARELAARAVAEGCDHVIAVGGDGTMNEVAGALVGTNAALGLVPCGSGDGLGRHLRIHGNLAHVFQVLRRGHSRFIDSGTADGHPFFSVAGLGLEAEIALRFNHALNRGFLGYLATGTATLLKWRAQEYVLVQGGGRERVRAFTLAVANSSQYGNNAQIAPGARIDDGALDLVAVPPLTPWNTLPLLARLFTGGLAKAGSLTTRRAARFTVERATPGPLHADGEVYPAGTSIEFLVHPKSLRVLCPDFPPPAENH